MMDLDSKKCIWRPDLQIIRKVLLFEKIAATTYSYSITSKTSRIKYHLFFKKSGILSVAFFTSIFDYHQTMFHSIPLISYQLYPETFRHKSVLSGLKHRYFILMLLSALLHEKGRHHDTFH